MSGVPPIPFVRMNDVAYGRRETVAPGVERVIARNPGLFTYTGTGTYIVGAAEPGANVAVIDPGPADDDHLRALLSALEGRTVSHILVTHTHRDHSPLSHRLAAATAARIAAAQPPALDAPAGSSEEGADERFEPDIILTGGERLTGSGWTLTAMATPGHASNHMAFAFEERNALFCGDHVMGWSTTIVAPPDGDMGDYLHSLDAVIARRFDTLWPTHGAPVTEPAALLDAYRAHRLHREAQIAAAVGAGLSQTADIVAALYAQVDRGLWPAAQQSVLAHLIKLVREGRVRADRPPALDAVYTPA